LHSDAHHKEEFFTHFRLIVASATRHPSAWLEPYWEMPVAIPDALFKLVARKSEGWLAIWGTWFRFSPGQSVLCREILGKLAMARKCRSHRALSRPQTR